MCSRVACVALLAFAGCSNLLGLTAPREQLDAGTDGGEHDAPGPDFSLRVTTPAPRVPQNSFDFLDVEVTRTGFDDTITVDIPDPPPGVTVTAATITAGSDTGSVKLAGSADLTVGSDLSLDVVATGGDLHHDVLVSVIVTLQPGTLDPSFGGDNTGIASLLFGSNQDDFFTDATFGPNDTIIAVGAVDTDPGFAVVARVTPAGALDTTFGSDGMGFTLTTGDPAAGDVQLLATAQLSSGNIVAVGNSPFGSDLQVGWTTAFEPDGTVDTEFDGDGSHFDATQQVSDAIVALTDGELLVVSSSPGGNGSAAPTLVGLTSNGDPDDDFDGDGSPVSLPIRFAHQLNGNPAALVADGAGSGVYIGGGLNGSAGGAVLHVGAAGDLDAAFAGSGAFALGSAATDATALVVQANGDLVVAGGPAFVARLTPAGDLDASFGSSGVADLGTTTLGLVLAAAIQADGKILVAGNNNGEVVVIRLLPDGTFDTSYGTAGVAFVSSFSLSELRVAPDGGAIGVGIDLAGEPLTAGLFRLAP